MLSAKFETVKNDSAQCWIYPLCDTTNLNSVLENTLNKVKVFFSDKSQQYLWHQDKFEVYVPVLHDAKFTDLPPHLYSQTCFGDNVEDEWFIVYLLLEVTKEDNGIIAQINDTDGEFLLIEAADNLPVWATPETTTNRVFIYNGEIHIIPPDIVATEKEYSVEMALKCIRKNPDKTRGAENIQEKIRKRVGNYPNQIKDNLHRAVVHLPLHIATILKVDPSLISLIINTYCSHDAIDAKSCKKLELKDTIDTTVTFSKCLYAMLKHSKMVNGSWNLPSNVSKDYNKKVQGLKISCGFEMLASKSSKDSFVSKEWKVYLDSLRANGYFRDNIEGSQNYTVLLEKAKNHFIAHECSYINSYVGENIKNIIQSDEFRIQNNMLKQQGDILVNDNEEWLNIKPDELDEILSSRFGKQTKLSDNNITPQTITSQLTNFLQQESDFEGIEVSRSTDAFNNSSDDKIELDCDYFAERVKNILDLMVPEDDWNLDSGTDLSEYGSDDDFEEDIGKSAKNTNQIIAAMDKEFSELAKTSLDVKDQQPNDVPRNTYNNIMQSMKEEMGSSGPSSNLLSHLGIPKSAVQMLDSDDEEI